MTINKCPDCGDIERGYQHHEPGTRERTWLCLSKELALVKAQRDKLIGLLRVCDPILKGGATALLRSEVRREIAALLKEKI